MAQEGKLSRKEKREIRKKRRLLRKDLRKKGIRSREEFEIVARQMGLVYGEESAALAIPWWAKLGTTLSQMGMQGLITTLVFLVGGTGLMFTYSSLANQKGNFTVSVSGDLMNIGFDLSDTEGFEDPSVRLKSQVLHEVNATSIQDLPDNLDTGYSGSHNMENVMAYTYWIRNAGQETVDFDWYMILNSVTKGLDECVWIMIYDEGFHKIYSRQIRETGEAEHLSGYYTPPLYEASADPENQYYQTTEGTWGVRTFPYLEERIVTKGTVTDFEPGEKHKYTVVIWIEGDDPECTDEIMGSHAGFAMKYTVAGDDDGIFDDLIYEDLGYEDPTSESSSTEEETPKPDNGGVEARPSE